MKKLLRSIEKNATMFADFKYFRKVETMTRQGFALGGGGKSSLGKGFGLFKALKTACNYLHRNSKVLLILSFCLITTVVLAAGRCVPCKLNHYCVDGLRYQCPANAPVTQGTGAGALNECLTCTQRNGNSANPIYDDLVGDCVSCYEYDSSTPIWDGNSCVACASGTAFNGETGLCESNCPGNINDAGVCILTAKLNECESGYIGIMTAEQLAQIGVDANYPLDGSYCLLNDISLAAYGENYNNGEGWTPIGNTNNNFTGVFDGNGHVISDLYINRPNDGDQGLFGYAGGATSQIRNIGVVDVNVTGSGYVGGLAGKLYSGMVSNSYAKGIITGSSNVGGLVGGSWGDIANSFADCTVSGSYVGGLVGSHENGTIKNSYSTGSVFGYDYVGGLLGHQFYLDSGLNITNCYTTSIVTANSYGGAFIGRKGYVCGYAYIENSFALANDVLGFWGEEFMEAGAPCSYEGTHNINHIGLINSSEISSVEMQTPQTFIDAGWDTSIWELVQGQYPKLKGVGGQD